MKSIALVHITSSEHGVRIVSVADMNIGNLADNQIALAQKLGYKADESCIDATRNSFAPKEEDIIYINEELLFNYYDEAFDKVPVIKRQLGQLRQHLMATMCRHRQKFCLKKSCLSCQSCRQ